jgi:hypothetical protein
VNDEPDVRDGQAERRLREWLRDGADRLPARALEPVLAHAESHPRRAGRIWIEVRRVEVTLRDGLAPVRRPVKALAVAVVLIAAIGLGTWRLAPAVFHAGSPLDGWIPATAVDACTTHRYPVQLDATRWAAGRLECQYRASDPRQDGTRWVALSTLTVKAAEPAGGSGAMDEIYGRATQQTAGGPWQCVFSGQVDELQRIAAVCRDPGGGAAQELLIVGTSVDGSDWTYRSWIEPATPGDVPDMPEVEPWAPGAAPDPTELAAPEIVVGAEACVVLDPGREERVGDAVHVRGEQVRCEIESSDERIAGTLLLQRSSERLRDGQLTTWGTARLTTADRTWTGLFVGSSQPQLNAGSSITRAWLVPADGGSGEIVLREEGPATDRTAEAEIRP